MPTVLHRRTKQQRLFLVVVVGLSLGALGLTAQRVFSHWTPGPSPAPRASPIVAITRPSNGATLPPGRVRLETRVLGLRLVDKIGSPHVRGEGHLLYYLDVDFIPTDPDRAAYTVPETYVASAKRTHTWRNLRPGRHTFFVQLVNNDDTPLQPAVTDSVVITVARRTDQ